MTSYYRSNQAGRSMVEMLGVLAIIGVLSVGGISGYSKAMAKFKLTKVQDQITMLLMNIRTAYATSPNYGGLHTKEAIDYNIAPGDMKQSGSTLGHAFGGKVTIEACDAVGVPSSTGQYFYIQLDDLGNEACMSLVTADWGTDGLIGISAGKQTSGKGSALTFTTITVKAESLPMNMSTASSYCGKGSYSTVKWVYY